MTPDEEAALAEIEAVFAGMSQEEVAARWGISQRTVGRIEARALRKLRVLISPDWAEGLREPPRTQRAVDGRPTDGMTRRLDERVKK